MKAVLFAMVVLVSGLSAQSGESIDSVRVTVTPPDCSNDRCWPYGVLLTSRGRVSFAQALVHRDSDLDRVTTRAFMASAADLTLSGLPAHVDDDPVLCNGRNPKQPIITVSVFHEKAEWRIADFRWCTPVAASTDDVVRRRLDSFARLRHFEDSVLALPAVVAHVKP